MERRALSVLVSMAVMAVLSMPLAVNAKKAITEEEALARIERLPEVRTFIARTARSKDNVRPIIRLEEDAAGDRDVFEFYVGESHPTHTAVWNRFFVNRKSGAITVLDIETGDPISLDLWRDKLRSQER